MSESIDRVQALPILLLVIASLLFGSGVWGLIRIPPLPAAAAILLAFAIGTFGAAAWLMRRRQLILKER
ncbi:MAG: hypothetical protein AAF290_01900 [Pseudomonadota bacterium]